jgi:membrane protein
MDFITGWKRFPHVVAQFIVVTWREVGRDHCQLLAAGLTYTTLIAVVPVLAVSLAVLKGLNYEENLVQWLIRNALPVLQEEYQRRVLDIVNELIGNVSGRVLGLMGGIGLFLSVSLFFGNIESAFNRVWKISRGRQAIKKTILYVGVLVIAAVLMVTAISLDITGFVLEKLHVQDVKTEIVSTPAQADGQNLLGQDGGLEESGKGSSEEPYLNRYAGVLVTRVLPFLITFAAFLTLYYLVPNTHVRFRSAFLGGLTAVISWTLVKALYIFLQVGVNKANTLYGGLAAFPLALGWVYMSWLIVLIGAEVAAISDRGLGSYILPPVESLPFSVQEEVGIRIMILLARAFRAGNVPPTARDLDLQMSLHEGTIVRMLETLEKRNLVRRLAEPDSTFIPARGLEDITISDVREAVRKGSRDIVLHRKDKKDETISMVLARMAKGAYEAGGKTTLAELTRPDATNHIGETEGTV